MCHVIYTVENILGSGRKLSANDNRRKLDGEMLEVALEIH